MLTNGGREKVNATKTTNFALRLERNSFFFKKERDKYPFKIKICHDVLYENNFIRLFHSVATFGLRFAFFFSFANSFFTIFSPLKKS